MAISADDLLMGAADVGLRVNNLFQIKIGDAELWQANVRSVHDKDGCFEFGRGSTPVLALIAAYKCAGVVVEDDGT